MGENDLISREEAIKALCKAGCGSGYCGVSCDDVMAIERLPSVYPKWIPCTERLPEISDKVLCCDMYGEYLIGHLYRDDTSDTGYSADDYEGCWVSGCVAWMPLPEPWKGENDETD